MRTITLLLLSGLALPALRAQHCGYDFAALLVVRPHAHWDTTVVDGLRITLLDSNNVPMTFNGRPYPPFYRNSDPKARDQPWVNHHPRRGELLFPFAKDNYVLVIGRGMDLRGCSILVQDERPWGSQAVFRQTVVPLALAQGYSLCGHYDEAFYYTHPHEAPYAPVDIPLFTR